MVGWDRPDAIRVADLELLRTVGPRGNELFWIPGAAKPLFGGPVRLHPEAAIPGEQFLLSCFSLVAVAMVAGYMGMQVAAR